MKPKLYKAFVISGSILYHINVVVVATIANIPMTDNWQGEVHGLSVSASGDSVFLSGHTFSNRDLNGLTSINGADVWAAQVPTDGGSRLWLTSLSSPANDFSYSNNIYVASRNRLYVHGQTAGQLQSNNVTSGGTVRGFVAELFAHNGSVVNIWYYGDQNSVINASSIEIGANGVNFYVSGTVVSSLNGKSVVGSSGRDLYLANYLAGGATNVWTVVWGSISHDDLMAGSHTGGSSSEIYTAGSALDLPGFSSGQSGGNYDLFLCRHQLTSGQINNCYLYGNSGPQFVNTFVVNASIGAAYLSGYTNGTFGGQSGGSSVPSAFTARLSISDGSLEWLRTWGNSSTRNIGFTSLLSSLNGDLYVGGSTGDVSLDGQALIGQPCDLSLTRLSASGLRSWTKTSGSVGVDVVYAMALDAVNRVWLGTLNGNSYVQLAVMSSDLVDPNIAKLSSSDAATATATIDNTGGDGGLTGGWFSINGPAVLGGVAGAIVLILGVSVFVSVRRLKTKRLAAAKNGNSIMIDQGNIKISTGDVFAVNKPMDSTRIAASAPNRPVLSPLIIENQTPVNSLQNSNPSSPISSGPSLDQQQQQQLPLNGTYRRPSSLTVQNPLFAQLQQPQQSPQNSRSPSFSNNPIESIYPRAMQFNVRSNMPSE